MNVVFLFLSRADLNAIPRIPAWLNQQGKIEAVLAFVNPHLAINPTDDQVALEDQILKAMNFSGTEEENKRVQESRMTMEMTLQQRWMQIPRDVLMEQIDKLFEPLRISTKSGVVVFTECFQADRLTEMLTKIRPAWPKAIPFGGFMLVYPNQIPETAVGRPKGKIQDPVKLKIAQDRMAKARAARKKKAQPVAA